MPEIASSSMFAASERREVLFSSWGLTTVICQCCSRVQLLQLVLVMLSTLLLVAAGRCEQL
jgi:hypothetical protein